MAKMGRPRALTPEQVDEVRRRYALWQSNRPHRIAAELGVAPKTLLEYLKGNHKDGRAA